MNNNDQAKSGFWKTAIVVGVLLAIFLLVISIKELKSISYVGRDVPIMNVITVNGKGEKVSIPDVATFSFSVTENAKTVKEAQDKATEKINSAIQAVKGKGVSEKDIKTTSYNINPHYEYIAGICSGLSCKPGRSVLSGYDVSQSIEVKVRDISKAGDIFDTIGSLEVQNVNGLTFSIDDIDSVKAEARELAIADAQEKAKTLAKDLGVKLVRITSFYDSSDDNIYYARDYAMGMGGAMTSAKVPSPEIPAGEQKVTSKVSITYEIR